MEMALVPAPPSARHALLSDSVYLCFWTWDGARGMQITGFHLQEAQGLKEQCNK